MKKRIVSILLAVAMIAGMIPFSAIPAAAESTGKYIERYWDGSKVVETAKPTGSTKTTSVKPTETTTNGKAVSSSAQNTSSATERGEMDFEGEKVGPTQRNETPIINPNK